MAGVALAYAFRGGLRDCNLPERVQNLKLLSSKEKSSASDTIIGFGEITANQRQFQIVLKMMFPAHSDTYRESGAKQELELYTVVNKLLSSGYTPHLISKIANLNCNSISQMREDLQAYSPKDAEIFTTEVERIYSQGGGTLHKYHPVEMLVLEKSSGKSLGDALLTRRLSEMDLLSIVWQLLFTLAKFNEIGLRHGDLHPGNIFVEYHPGTQITYRTPNGQYVVPTDFFVKIYDWDWGGQYKYPLIVNPKATAACAILSSCLINDKADMFTVLSSIWSDIDRFGLRALYPNLTKELETWIHPALLHFTRDQMKQTTSGGFNYRLCQGPIGFNCETGEVWETQLPCSGPFDPPGCLMKSPEEVLSYPLFNHWRSAEVKGPIFAIRKQDRSSTAYIDLMRMMEGDDPRNWFGLKEMLEFQLQLSEPYMEPWLGGIPGAQSWLSQQSKTQAPPTPPQPAHGWLDRVIEPDYYDNQGNQIDKRLLTPMEL